MVAVIDTKTDEEREMNEQFAKILVTIGRARYKTRDMVADDDEVEDASIEKPRVKRKYIKKSRID